MKIEKEVYMLSVSGQEVPPAPSRMWVRGPSWSEMALYPPCLGDRKEDVQINWRHILISHHIIVVGT
jgi:hypothetical protein